MKMPRVGWRRALVSVAIIAAAAAATFGALTLLGGGSRAQAPQVDRIPGMRITANRDHVAICVKGVEVDPAVVAEATALVKGILADLVADPRWATMNPGGPPTVDNDCAAQPYMYSPELNARPEYDRVFYRARGRNVTIPGPYVALVFVVPVEDFARFTGLTADEVATRSRLRLPRFVGEERVVVGDVVHWLTTGLYVTPEDIADKDLMRKLISLAISFEY